MTPDDLNQLEQALRNRALNIRKAALDELATLPAEVAIPILKRLAAEPDFLLRRLAVMGLGNHRVSEAFEALESLLNTEEDSNVLAEAANSLFEFGKPAIPLLKQLFESRPNWLIRQTILSLLLETTEYATLLNLATQGFDDETQAVKETAILALRHVLSSNYQAEALALLTDLAQSEVWRDRWRAATALTGCQAPQAKQLVQQLQKDENYRVSAAALDAALQSGG
ncbi:MAG: HEAT repeat domain-containing protein [Cyanobacteria bacterium P01_F01_bin.4]